MNLMRQVWFGVVLGGCVLLAGCRSSGPQLASAPRDNPVVLKNPQQAEVQFALGQSLEKSGALEQAEAAYRDALAKDPKHAAAVDRLAVLHARKGELEPALALHKKALRLQPANPDFHCNLGYCLYLQQRWPEAESHFRKALELAPEHHRAQNNLGLVLAHTNRAQEALLAFQRAGCSDADAHSNLAFVLTLDKSWKEAEQHYAYARTLDPSSSAAENGLRTVSHLTAVTQGEPAQPISEDEVQWKSSTSAPKELPTSVRESVPQLIRIPSGQ
jgi:tetratricopeptide (TPR) repeat protein